MIVDGQEIECVTFDLDDTLWLCFPVILKAESVFYGWLGNHYPRIAEAFTFEGLIDHRRDFFSGLPARMAHDVTWQRMRWLEKLADDFACPRGHLVQEGFEVFLAARNDIELYDGAHEILRLASERYTCGTITNGNADVARIGIDHYFDFSITASGTGAAKPDPAIFLAAAEAAGMPPEKILHIGDDPERDIRGAANVRMKTLWINPDGYPWEGPGKPDMELRSINELAGLLVH